MVIALTMASRYEEAIVHPREVVLRNVDPHFQMDLKDALFDRFRTLAAFQRLEAEVGRTEAPRLSQAPPY